MSLFRRQPNPAPAPPAVEPPAEPEETRAEQIADFVHGSPEWKKNVARLLAEAIHEQQSRDEELAALRAATPKIADATGLPRDHVAAELAEASELSRAYTDFLSSNGLSTERPVDQRYAHQATLRAVERRRRRIEEKLADSHTTESKRVRLEEELDRLEEAENAAFSYLHPPSIGGVFSCQDEAKRGHFCPYCDAELSRDRAFDVGICTTCAARYELVTGQPVPGEIRRNEGGV